MEPFAGSRVRVERRSFMARTDPPPKTVDDLREDIDRGLTGEKVAGSDPAAAPLGTDAEAAGTPPTRREFDLEARSRPAAPPPEPRGGPRRMVAWLIGACVVAVLVVLALSWG
jgi:hypothetical protein